MKHVRLLAAIGGFALLMSVPGSAAHVVTVGCGGAGPFEYQTIRAALQALSASSSGFGAHITVAGTCMEHVIVGEGFDRLTITGLEGATIADPGIMNPPQPVFTVSGAREVTVTGLTFRGGGSPVDVVRVGDGSATFRNSTIEGGGGNGLFILFQGRVRIVGTTVHGNARNGIRVGHQSTLNVGDTFGERPGNVIRDNGGAGIRVDGGSSAWLSGPATVSGNGQGISLVSSNLDTCCSQEEAELRIEHNRGAGISASVGAKINAQSPITIAGNGATGVALSGGSAAVFNGDGASIAIRDNDGSGFNVAGNSNLTLRTVSVEQNRFRGITVADNSSVFVLRSTIRGNGREGILLFSNSVGVLAGQNQVFGNTLFDLACSNAVGRGLKSDVGRMFCPAFDQSPLPEPGNE